MAELKGSVKLGQYLKGLRVGYGYSLRKVEERARQQGGDVDNSQLSRYEKGLCYPSFDKLRTLGRIFNVSIQTFSDVVDLEELEKNLPAGDDALELLREGRRESDLGDYGRAYACFEKARIVAEQGADPSAPAAPEAAGAAAKARLSAAIALSRMNKLSLAEYELRRLLRLEKELAPGLIARVLLELSSVHRHFGEYLLAETEARRALAIAETCGEERLLAFAHHALVNVTGDRGELDAAIIHAHEALARYRAIGEIQNALRVKLGIGSLYAQRGQFREGIRLLRETMEEARGLGHRWTVASAAAWLGEIHFRRGDHESARRCIRESNALASAGDVQYVDILFLNSYYAWQIAQAENNAAEIRLALGRLKYLRPQLEQDLAEVRHFDRFMEKGGAQ